MVPQESQYAGKAGVVRAILNRMASIYLYDDGREIDVPCRYVEPIAPNKFDKVNQFVTGQAALNLTVLNTMMTCYT